MYLEKTITKIHFIFLGLAILTIYLLVNQLRFVGQYTNSMIGLTFLSSGIILFGLTTSKLIKIYSGLIAIPALLTEISLLFGATPFVLPALIGYLMFAAPLKKEKVNDRYNFEIHEGGIMAPPNHFYLTRQTCFIFDKQIRLTPSLEHFSEISKVEVIGFKENEIVICKIYIEDKNEFSVDTLQYDK
ncbi:MAG: hypothetical protein J0M30_01395 [Chitinophagales bacterium]|nr:hypothetical protein [Chitinophagales bacterium]